MIESLTLFDEDRHNLALESLALKALSDGSLAEAFKFADRRCRISPLAEVHHFTLRGEVSYRMGYADAARADIMRALELAPNDLSANRRMLAWGSGQAQIEAAQRLVNAEPDFVGIASAIAVLRQTGKQSFAALRCTDNTVTGWAVWRSATRARVTLDGGVSDISVWLTPDPRHPLAARSASAASFTLDRPRSYHTNFVSLYAGSSLVYRTRLRPNMSPPYRCGARSAIGYQGMSAPDSVNVIVPVYGDFDATKACFESLMKEIKRRPKSSVIVVDDASRDVRVKRLIRALSKDPHVCLLTNKRNLGFAASVNRALEQTGRSDVILLNADTVVPPDFIARLEGVARGDLQIGTITPFSNNGELTSLPVAFRSNPLGTYQDICEFDAAAARANADQFVDMPNGVGFCLYITRACLDAVGNLSEAFQRGYFEDVDFCLRARESGFRNVCALSVYVGHVGSRSFAEEKPSLVAHNLETIEQRFPKYRAECAAFLIADPLRPGRAAIERLMARRVTNATLLITGAGLLRSVVDARARDLLHKGQSVLIAEVRRAIHGVVLYIVNPAKDFPQSLSFELAAPGEGAAALDYLRRIECACVEIADPSILYPAVLELLSELDCPVDLIVTNAGLLCPRGSFIRPDGRLCDALGTGRPCDECPAEVASISKCAKTTSHGIVGPTGLIRRARHIYALGPHGKAFASRLIGRRRVIELKPIYRSRPANKYQFGPSIGVVAVGNGIIDYRLIKQTARALNRELSDRSIVVIGETIDDIGLMRLDNVFVTGAVQVTEYDRILRQYSIGALFIPVRQPLFGHPAIIDIARRVPTASFDWSLGNVPFHPADLALNPYLTDDELIASFVTWLAVV